MRLNKKDWEEIRKLLEETDRNISQIAKFYGVNRKSIYDYAHRHGWMNKKSKLSIRFKKWIKKKL